MKLFSPAFEFGHPIPVRFTCDGADVSPPLRWDDVPGNTASLALVCEDPDAPGGTWTHWILYRIPPSGVSLPEAMPEGANLPNGMAQGRNDFRRNGWGGPCPPPGIPHHYYFRLLALDAPTAVERTCDAKAFERATHDHVIAEATLMGTYQRFRRES